MKKMVIKQVEHVQSARDRARMYGTLAAIFNQKPDSMLVHNLRTMGDDFLNGLQQGNPVNRDVQESLLEISNFIVEAKKKPEEEIELTLQKDWTRLFRGIQPGYGPEPPYEGLYLGEGVNDFKALEAVAHFYAQHGVSLAEEAANRPDYIGVELDFLRYLCEQQTAAWEKGDEIKAQEWQLAEYDFLNHHLGKWAAIFCDRAVEEAKTGFYRGFVLLTKQTIEEMANTIPLSIGKN